MKRSLTCVLQEYDSFHFRTFSTSPLLAALDHESTHSNLFAHRYISIPALLFSSNTNTMCHCLGLLSRLLDLPPDPRLHMSAMPAKFHDPLANTKLNTTRSERRDGSMQECLLDGGSRTVRLVMSKHDRLVRLVTLSEAQRRCGANKSRSKCASCTMEVFRVTVNGALGKFR